MDKKAQMHKSGEVKYPQYIVGMDAHSRKLAISVWDWTDVRDPHIETEIKDTAIESMETVYKRHVSPDSLTLIEATTNAGVLKQRLEAIGYAAEIVRADTLLGRERKRKIRDIQDARNLALAYMRGAVDSFVMAPQGKTAERRELLAAYREAVKETTRISNRIWDLCAAHGLVAPGGHGASKVKKLRELIAGASITAMVKMRFEYAIEDYERMWERRERLNQNIAEIVATTPQMRNLMQLSGVAHCGAFALVAAIGDIRRFATPAKLVAYCGFAPIVNTSGEEEERARIRGGTGKPLDGEGRRDVKDYFVEAGHTVLMKLPKSSLGKWGWALIHRGKNRNKVVCAIGRKLLTYAWHILHGDPTPNRHDEEFFARKMLTLHMTVSAKRMKELNFGSRKDFAQMACESIYGNLPKNIVNSRTTSNEDCA